MMPLRQSVRQRAGLATLLSLACGATATGHALAAGLEVVPGGNQSVARGGANLARAEDATSLARDPAGLAFLEGSSLLLDVNVPLHSMCVDPYGYYGWGAYGSYGRSGSSEFGDELALDDPASPTPGATYASTPLPRVCNSAKTIGIPQLLWSTRVGRLAIAAGFVAPVFVPGLQYGGSDGTISTASGPRPTPTRYSLVKQQVLFGLNPTLGVAYRFLPQLAAGLTLQVLSAKARAVAVQNAYAGTQPSTDWLSTVETQDYFLPRVVASLHAKPVRALDLVVSFEWSDDFRGPGQLTVETNTYHQGHVSGPVPYRNDPVDLDWVSVRMPWKLNAGARWAGLLPGGGSGLRDPMDTELWDVEVDASAALDGLSRSAVRVGQPITVETRLATGGGGRLTVENLPNVEIDRHQRTTYTARLGGSFAVLPRKLQVHAGVFHETRSVDAALADVDTFAFARVGGGLGATLRLGSVDLRAAYSHVGSETLEVAPPPHEAVEAARFGAPRSGFDKRVGGSFSQDGTRIGGVVLEDPAAPSPGNADGVAARTQDAAVATAARPERVINAGRYTAAFDVISVGVVYHF